MSTVDVKAWTSDLALLGVKLHNDHGCRRDATLETPMRSSKYGTVEKRRMQIRQTLLADYSHAEEVRVPWQTEDLLINYMVTTSLPYLDAGRGVAQNGIFFSGCRFPFQRSTSLSVLMKYQNLEDKVYSDDGFKEHFRECQGAQKLWELSNKGFNVSGVSTRLEGGEPFVKLHGNVKIPQ
ncbi:Pc20g10560 [Penicillium rubens Wisconsin 54-1255]|uniref:Pc20g10560 protein n=1 Tax=Penicillium rubens (strain ATCC 28089 / DSM 1075 / NRRL 1951 / Wisconsin 54-1255) TaxID=500485 RepID=B6HFV1_PENRW|nr:Pc20g10560 [Penicillium rubens Wisconsin 54-1255]